MRMCIVCKTMVPKKELIRIVRNEEGYFIDRTLRMNGRGAYLCNNPLCMEVCLKKRQLNRAFKTEIPAEVYQKLLEEYGK